MSTVTTPKTLFKQDDEGRWWIPKDPDAVLDYSVDWTKWLATVDDLIASFSTVLDGATELTVDQEVLDGNKTHAYVSGGITPDSMQSLTFRIVTLSTPPRVEDRTVYLKITER